MRKQVKLTPANMTTVLLVDDDADNLQALRTVIESAGYSVVPATSGEDALSKLSDARPRMIVTDWQMPGMDGLQFCQTVRKQATYALIPIIMLSANVEPVGEAGCWSAFFRKPVSLDVLIELIFRFSTVGRTTRQAFLECADCATSRWQGVDARAWP